MKHSAGHFLCQEYCSALQMQCQAMSCSLYSAIVDVLNIEVSVVGDKLDLARNAAQLSKRWRNARRSPLPGTPGCSPGARATRVILLGCESLLIAFCVGWPVAEILRATHRRLPGNGFVAEACKPVWLRRAGGA